MVDINPAALPPNPPDIIPLKYKLVDRPVCIKFQI